MKRCTVALTLLLGACSGDRGDAEFTVREEVRGDTLVVISSGDPGSFLAPPVEVTWKADELGNPRSLAKVGEYIVVGDGNRIHVLDLEGAHQRTFGRRGDGPGELRNISSVVEFGDDTIAVFDERLNRVSFYSLDGGFIGSRAVTPDATFSSPSGDPPFVRWGSGLLWIARGGLTPGQPRQVAAIWHDLDADSAVVMETWDDVVFEELTGGIFGSRDLYPTRVIAAISRSGRIAEGNGHDYCVRVQGGEDPQIGLWCREAVRLPVGSGIRAPDLALLEGDPQIDFMHARVRDLDSGEFLPHFDRILFSEAGDLWVRTFTQELADIHPVILGRRPELAPASRRWEVFDSDGRLVREVSLPFHFRPRVILGDRVFGFWALETGEVTIGRVSLNGADFDP